MSVEVVGNLYVTHLNGRYGKFAKGTLTSSLGQFDVRGEWLEELDEGDCQGTFWVSNITLFNYLAYNEVRVGLRAHIEDYQIDSRIDDFEATVTASAETVALPKPQPQKAKAEKVVFLTDEELQAEKLLRSCLAGDEIWTIGQPYIVDKSMSRQRILECTNALKTLDYSLDVVTQTWNQRGDV